MAQAQLQFEDEEDDLYLAQHSRLQVVPSLVAIQNNYYYILQIITPHALDVAQLQLQASAEASLEDKMSCLAKTKATIKITKTSAFIAFVRKIVELLQANQKES